LRFNCLKYPPRSLVSPPRSLVALAMSIAMGLSIMPVDTVLAADKPFQAKPIDQYANKQTTDGLTIAAEPFTTDDQAKDAFGKLNPWRYNILPVLVVIRNDSPNAIRLEKLHFEYDLPDRSKIDAMPAADVKYSQGPGRPRLTVSPIGGLGVGKGKRPLNVPEIEIRAFSAKMLPPGDVASGFIYFETDIYSAGASLYITGLQNAATGKDLYYFEVPLSGK
jgi:hypothetical protein